jgi:hypothetical protein
MGTPVLFTQSDQLYLGNNAWARGSFNGDVFTLKVDAPQFQHLVARHPNFMEMSEVERSKMFSQEAWNAIKEDPKHFAWLLLRKTFLFMLPMQYWDYHGWYRYNYVYFLFFVLAAACVFLRIKNLANERYIILLLIPILAVFITTLIIYAFDRYRFVIEPFYLLLGAYGAALLFNKFGKRFGWGSAIDSSILSSP